MPTSHEQPSPANEPLRRLLAAVEAAGRVTLPGSDSELLQSIVEAAARIFGAAAASIALVDEDAQSLIFKVACGVGNEDVVGMKVPLNKGLAGYVALTGQPLAISNVQQDQRFNQDFAKSTGYVPQSILATPLFAGDRVIGVMEVLDKLEAPSFGMRDMELLGLFARQAAIAINQSQLYSQLGAALAEGLRRLVSPGDADLASIVDGAVSTTQDSFLSTIAERLYAISKLGEKEQQACLDVLSAFQRYAQSKSEPAFG
jgi:GAF domain-containing protein